MFVGDHPENDVEAAQRVGMIGIWKQDAQFNNRIANFIVDDLVKLPRLVKNIHSI
ncbi:hypothetical protein [Halalkalibacter alkalisediminis]|uniref:HAD family hydrolase n=1 Tax=Halalkalibacter alkalisediminis TaxID=935616 RepID=A0ABV6NHD0_9BACI